VIDRRVTGTLTVHFTLSDATVSLSMSKRIAQARCEKKLTQKELAALLSLPAKIVQEYESGKAIPNHVVINKLEKALGCRLRDPKGSDKK
jgi:putative transcription factor